ncbi:uncharacterized protein LOC133338658 [Musca vetustissima]|uniref:uncharacterized protein LOC133338658 n=1 Tax=Musca vetustissima TaxID=27455 RepID=UPI002AB62DE9|nr:uncharacterized protein LOC133338658 [Musca vetustissima]
MSLKADIRISNLRCTTKNESLGKFQMCSLKAVKRNVVEINVHFELFKKPVKQADFLLRFKKRGDIGGKALYQYKVDLCEFLNSDRRKPLANLFYNFFELQRYSNLNHSCPYDHDIIVKGCRLNAKLLQVLPIPPGEYSIWTSWIIFGRQIAEVEVALKYE